MRYARRQLVAAFQLLAAVLEPLVDQLDRFVILLACRFEIGLDLVVLDGDLPPVCLLDFGQAFLGDFRTLLHRLRRRGGGLANQHVLQRVERRAVQNRPFIVPVLGEAGDFFAFDGERALVLVNAVAVEDTDFDNRTGHTGRQTQRGIADVRSLLAKNGTQKFFFRRHRAIRPSA